MPFGKITKQDMKNKYDTEGRRSGMRPLNPKQKEEVKSIVKRKLEINYLNYIPAAMSLFNTPFINDITSAISQGITDNQRIGDQLEGINLEMRVHLYLPTSATLGFYFSRIIIFQWRVDTTSVVPTAPDILLLGTGGTVNYTSLYNHDKRSLYKIMYDRTFCQNGVCPDSMTSNGAIYTRKFLKIPHKVISYDSVTTTGIHHIYLMVLGSGTSSSDCSKLNLAAKLKYRG